jgi:hypothetical protein
MGMDHAGSYSEPSSYWRRITGAWTPGIGVSYNLAIKARKILIVDYF